MPRANDDRWVLPALECSTLEMHVLQGQAASTSASPAGPLKVPELQG